ncbi:uncharacterized protein DNG_05770 [Cephalotrichum gorgonifer]|uniref:Cyclin n=1 Tax=Cephalotrichum gorgonifer TaxID=2041049 RepID=A0AAE8SVU5_9PEZI|nr:uncharacterized protein DNG_05770 [Cephalotrichum gorgonifer]
MFSTTNGLPNTKLPSPPAQNWSCGQRGWPTLDTTIPSRRQPDHWPSVAQAGPRTSFGGLRTPPTEDMSTACHQPSLGQYDSRAMSTYPPTILSQAERTKASLPDPILHGQQARYNPQQQSYPDTQSRPIPAHPARSYEPRNQAAVTLPLPGQASQPPSQTRLPNGQPSRSSTPGSAGIPPQRKASEGLSSSLTGQSSEIPEFICARGGSLPDLVAQITCFFWFEPIEVLRTAETFRSQPNTPVRRLSPEARPQANFTKWVHNILSTTQVTRNVILLALLFIYRLKTLNPAVRGRPGSEYRLLTVALMLGNKFLDDNTYTNKTWADVSYLSVSDIHLMEVEFLSNMRYSLLTTKEDWEAWLAKVGSFYDYYDAATRQPSPGPPKMTIPSPTTGLYSSPVPSPTHSNGMVSMGPTSTMNYSPNTAPASNAQNWLPAMSPLANLPHLPGNAQKRSLDLDLVEPPAKRISHGPYVMGSGMPRHAAPVTSQAQQPQVNSMRRMGQVPTLTIDTTHDALSANQGLPFTPTNGGHGGSQPMMSLPPLVPGVRAMHTVYSQGPPSGGVPSVSMPQLPAPNPVYSNVLKSQQHPQVQALQPSQHAQAPPIGYSTPTKSQATHGMYNSSPLAEAYQSGSVAHTPVLHTPISHSPSVYLQQRPSPYKPVRHVNTLLYPPPSASLEEYHLAVPPQQMHYRPLGRRDDLRTGIVPEFVPPFRYPGQTY